MCNAIRTQSEHGADGVVGARWVRILDLDNNQITENGAFLNLIAGDVDVTNSRVVAASGSASAPASAVNKVVVNVIAKDNAGNILTVAEPCAVPPTGDPCPLVVVTFVPDDGFPTFTPLVTVRKSEHAEASFEVLYLMRYPGYYSVNVRFTRGTGTPLSPYGMYATPQTSPVLQSCIMENTLGGILCQFDKDTNTPGKNFLPGEGSGTGIGKCGATLAEATVALLGRDPACTWKDRKTLHVTTGVGPTIRVRSETSAADR
eukprot:8779385-Pyramimonas_sp.AAC.1